jgi:uncharacterized delta-60 repeat protein
MLLSLAGIAQPGSLDITFSDDGKQTTGFQLPSVKTNDQALSIAIQTDGKIVVAGFSENSFTVARFNETGTLDNTFNLTGKASVNFGGNVAHAHSVAIQKDGKIVIAGYTYTSSGSNYDFAVARFNTDGTPDKTFSEDGKLTTDFNTPYGTHDEANSVAIQTDGKIVVAGFTGTTNSVYLFAIARYNSDGVLDNTFNDDGELFSGFRFVGGNAIAHSVAIQKDGKIVASGMIDNNVGVARYTTDGTLDNTFDGNGALSTDFGSTDAGFSAAIQDDGKIIVAGTSNNNFVLARYNTNGSLDNTFSGDGKLTTDFSGTDGSNSVAIQPDGKIIAAGYSNMDFAIVRYNADGTLDNTFSADGKLVTDIRGTPDYAHSVAVQANGKIVAAGSSYNSSDNDFAIVRYNADGSLDNTFSSNGELTTDIGGAYIAANDNGAAVLVKSNGKIVVAGTSSTSGTNAKSELAIVQYKSNGKPDNNFGFQGKVLGEFEGGNFVARTAAVQTDGKIIVGGYFDIAGKHDFALVRYNADGSLDKTFSSDGFVTTKISLIGPDHCQALGIQPDGKIVAAGSSQDCLLGSTFCKPDFAVVRYNADGTLDNFFSLDGKLTTDFASNADVINSVALQQDGKIVVAGYTYTGSHFDMAVARYNANGDPDNTFSGDGKLTTDFSSFDDFAQCVKIQADGKIVVGGYSGKTSVKDNDFALVRYNTNGTLDNLFSSDGKQTTTISGTSTDFCLSLAIEPGGNIIAGGYYINAQQQADFALVRYLSNGAGDNTFGTSSKVITDFASTNDFGTSIAIGSDGKLVMAGHSNNDFAVARYNLAAAAFTNMAAIKKEMHHTAVDVLPNPFSSKASVLFTLDKDALVIIELLDATGTKIKTITNERLLKGNHQIELSKGILTAGIYFLRIVKDKEVLTKKVVIE